MTEDEFRRGRAEPYSARVSRLADQVRAMGGLVVAAELADPVEREALRLAVLELVRDTGELARSTAERLGFKW